MTAAALYMCSTPGCPCFTPTIGPCHDCQRARSLRRGPSGWESESERNAYLAAHPFCVICNEPATTMDHIVRLEDGGVHEESNFQSLCKQCDDRKQVWEGGRAPR